MAVTMAFPSALFRVSLFVAAASVYVVVLSRPALLGALFLSIPLYRWLLAGVVFAVVWSLLGVLVPLSLFFIDKLISWSASEQEEDTLRTRLQRQGAASKLGRSASLASFASAAAACILPLQLHQHHPGIASFVDAAMRVALGFYLVRLVWAVLVALSMSTLLASPVAKELNLNKQWLEGLLRFLRPLFYCVGFAVVADVAGFQISTLAAGLGIGGVALALALQSLLQDLFAAACLLLDRPFKLGDFVSVDTSASGTVERIGVRSTTLRSAEGEAVTFPNRDIAAARLHNFADVRFRRRQQILKLKQDTDPLKLEKLPDIVQHTIAAVSKEQQVDIKVECVALQNIADWCLEYLLIYTVKHSDLSVFRKMQHFVNIHLLKALQSENVSLAVAPAWSSLRY